MSTQEVGKYRQFFDVDEKYLDNQSSLGFANLF